MCAYVLGTGSQSGTRQSLSQVRRKLLKTKTNQQIKMAKIIGNKQNWVQWLVFVIPVLVRLRLEDHCKFKI